MSGPKAVADEGVARAQRLQRHAEPVVRSAARHDLHQIGAVDCRVDRRGQVAIELERHWQAYCDDPASHIVAARHLDVTERRHETHRVRRNFERLASDRRRHMRPVGDRNRQANAKCTRTDRGQILAIRCFRDLDDALSDAVERESQRAGSQRLVVGPTLHDHAIRQAFQRFDIACGHWSSLLRSLAWYPEPTGHGRSCRCSLRPRSRPCVSGYWVRLRASASGVKS
ncbi:hypothetical protein [Sphingomonas sp. LR55]|uniref:hypothetical protein n=1 Tax=Sphingomonas sp. LR55 TaxID=3050231 RepID=UPI002FE335A8